MEITVHGYGPNDNVETQVDPTHAALRESIRPLEHNVGGVIGGHYGVTAASGLLAVQTAASSGLFAVRWYSPSAKLMVLLKLTIGINVTTNYSAATDGGEPDFEMYLSRNYLTNPSGGNTAAAWGSISQLSRNTMAPSEFTTNGAIQVANTGALTTGSPTLDSYPYSYAVGSSLGRSLGSLGTAELVNVYRTGQHPIVFNSNQGLLVRNTRQLAGAAGTGVSRINVAMEWAEVAAY